MNISEKVAYIKGLADGLNCDDKIVKEILDVLMSVREQTTVIFSTHILSDVERICSGVAFLHDGKIALQGSVDELKNRYGAE